MAIQDGSLHETPTKKPKVAAPKSGPIPKEASPKSEPIPKVASPESEPVPLENQQEEEEEEENPEEEEEEWNGDEEDDATFLWKAFDILSNRSMTKAALISYFSFNDKVS